MIVTLGEQELTTLVALAERKYSDTRAQATLLIYDEFIWRGLLHQNALLTPTIPIRGKAKEVLNDQP
jgi:hypothetical protein